MEMYDDTQMTDLQSLSAWELKWPLETTMKKLKYDECRKKP
jgi:hypothetical protein